MRKPLIAGNWKMHKTIAETIETLNCLKRNLVDFESADILVCPVYTALSDARDVLLESNIALGAQDMYWQEAGAFTGEIAPPMLKDVGCSFVIIGHSERRQHFHETNATVNKKLQAALKAALTPIMCIGETLTEREADKTIAVVESQLAEGLNGINADALLKIVIAYEPVWAIGTGKTATPQQAQEIHAFIRNWIKKQYSGNVADEIRILYGGSIKPSNIQELMQQPDVDGGLVGGASLDCASFTEIVTHAV